MPPPIVFGGYPLVLEAVWLARAVVHRSDWRHEDKFFAGPTARPQDANGTILVGFPLVLAVWLLAAVLIGRRTTQHDERVILGTSSAVFLREFLRNRVLQEASGAILTLGTFLR